MRGVGRKELITLDSDKVKRIKVEEIKLWKALDDLSDNQKSVLESTVYDAAFKSVSLEDLHKEINEEGYIEEYQNGSNQSGRKVSSYVQVYNAMEKSYQSQIKILFDPLPENIHIEKSDGFDEFVDKK